MNLEFRNKIINLKSVNSTNEFVKNLLINIMNLIHLQLQVIFNQEAKDNSIILGNLYREKTC